MKDVAACEKLRGAGKRALIRRYPNGETHPCIDGFLDELCRRGHAATKAQLHFKHILIWDQPMCALVQELCRRADATTKAAPRPNEGMNGQWRVMYAGVAQAEYIGLVRRTR